MCFQVIRAQEPAQKCFADGSHQITFVQIDRRVFVSVVSGASIEWSVKPALESLKFQC